MYLSVNLLNLLSILQGAQGLAHPGNLLMPPWGELKTIDMKLFQENGFTKQALHLLRK